MSLYRSVFGPNVVHFPGMTGMGALKRIAIWTAIGATLIGLAFVSGIAPAP